MECSLKDGSVYILREIELKDARPMLVFLDHVASESDNLTFGPGEFTPTVEEEESFIQSHSNSENCYALVAVLNGRIIGNLSFQGGGRNRIAHCGEFGVSVLKEFWGNGIASALIENMLEWSKTSPITKINLRVKEDNTNAIDLYKKFGFEIECVLKRDFKINNLYCNSVMMGKIISILGILAP